MHWMRWNGWDGMGIGWGWWVGLCRFGQERKAFPRVTAAATRGAAVGGVPLLGSPGVDGLDANALLLLATHALWGRGNSIHRDGWVIGQEAPPRPPLPSFGHTHNACLLS